jgi:hypothetical protein
VLAGGGRQNGRMSLPEPASARRLGLSSVLRRLTGGAMLGLAGLIVASIAGGCRGEDVYFDCEDQEAAFRATAATEGDLLASTPKGEPYPVAIKFSEDGLNRLLEGVVGQDVPFTGQLPFVWFSGPGTLHFQATSDPIIELESLEGCPTCVQYSLDFNVVLVGADGEPEGAGIGSVKFRIPLLLEPDGERATTLYADYTQLRVQDLWLSAFGLVTEEHEALVTALGWFMQEKIQESYGKTELLRLDSWEIGNNDVRLLARKLIVFPEENTLALAMQSNLPLPPGAGLELTGEMPTGVPMVVDFDVSMFEAMIERLLHEGEIPRVYNEKGEPDEDGNYGVTIDYLRGAPAGQEFMTTQFKVWRFADGYCGYAVAQMDLDVGFEPDDGVTITPSDVVVIGGQGSGAVAAQDKQLVDENQEVVNTFRDGVASNLVTTINYDALEIEGSNIVFETLQKDLKVDHLEVWIDFLVVEKP